MLTSTRSVGVLGGGIAAFAAAIAFRRSLPDVKVALFDGGGEAEPEYVGAASPAILHFHQLAGIDAELFRRRTGAVVTGEVEIRRAGQPAFRLVSLAEPPFIDGAALHQLWLRRTMDDPAAAWADTARRARRREDVMEGLGPRFDATAYLVLLREVATHIGVEIRPEERNAAELASSHDLVIDTEEEAGGDWLRIGDVPGQCRWKVNARTAGGDTVETVELAGDRILWNTGAWRAEAPIDADAGAAGRAVAPWQGNVLAIGRAAVQCETFDGQPLAVALAGIVRALDLLPRPGAAGYEVAEYNRRSAAVHDFLLDWAAERWGSKEALRPGHALLRRQFGERGRIPFRDEDPVQPGQWIGWLLGSGERPLHVDLTAMAIPEERLETLFAAA